MQFRLVHLLAAMGVLPIACGMLVYATPWGAAAIFSLSITSLLAALVLVAVANGPARSFSIGFAVFGIGYWAVLHSSFLSMRTPDETAWRLRQDGPPLITGEILEWLYDRALPLVHKQPVTDAYGNVTNGSRYPRDPAFNRTGHSLFDLSLAIIGGMIGTIAHRRYQPRPTAERNTDPR